MQVVVAEKAGVRIGKDVIENSSVCRDSNFESWMRLPKYSNPHLTADTTRIVSRETLRLQDDDVEWGGEAEDVQPDKREVEDLRAKLEGIVSKRLKLKRALTSSDESRSSKRTKLLVEDGEGGLIEPPEPVGEFESSCPHPANPQNSRPSIPFGIEITVAPCHLSHSKNPQGHTVCPHSRHHWQFTQAIVPVSRNHLAKTLNRNSKSAPTAQPSLPSIINKSRIHSRWCVYLAFSFLRTRPYVHPSR